METKYYVHRSTGTQGTATDELWNTIPYHLHRNNTWNISMVYTYVHPKKLKYGLKRKETELKRKEKKKKTKRNQNKHALRAQAESLGDTVAVCWYDQSYDMSS